MVSGIAFGFGPSGTNDDGVVVRYNPNGSLDPTFGTGGIVHIDTGGANQILDIALQSDQKIVAAGSNFNDFHIMRFNTTGSLDPTFGSGGMVFTDFVVDNAAAVSVVIQQDGRIVAGGQGFSSPTDFYLARYNPNGSLDPTFDVDGKLTTDFGNSDGIQDLAIDFEGKIVAVGQTVNNGSGNFALARYNVTGSLDPTFGSGGKVITNFGNSSGARAIALQDDGKIIAGGISNLDFAVARYNGTIILTSCNLFSEDFEDGVLATDWTYVKQSWNEIGGNLVGTPVKGKAEVIATPAFAGCGTGQCIMQSAMQTDGGLRNKVWFLAWYQDKNNTIEVLMNEETNKWILRQRSGGAIVAKVKASQAIQPNTSYLVKVTFDGTTFTLSIDGVDLVTMPAAVAPSGTFGYQVKNTTARFGAICIN